MKSVPNEGNAYRHDIWIHEMCVPKLVTLTITALLVSGICVSAALSVSPPGSSSIDDFLETTKLHLNEVNKDLKIGNSQEAMAQINMTLQAIISAEWQVNSSIVCNNIVNEGFCATS
jgi:predicted PurR-regulated permease PerM